MPVVSPQIAEGKKNRESFIEYLTSLLPESQLPNPPGMEDVPLLPSTYQDAGKSILNMLIPQPEDTLIAPAELRPNFRNPQQIQLLRRLMAEEQRARGPLNRKLLNPEYDKDLIPYSTPEEYAAAKLARNPRAEYQMAIDQFNYLKPNDPIDQILRGSWYHGMSEKAKQKVGYNKDINAILTEYPSIKDYWADKLGYKDFNEYKNISKQLNPYIDESVHTLDDYATNSLIHQIENNYPKEMNITTNKIEEPFLGKAFQGFPLSAHDAQSISNKLGEPAGVSLSLNPTVSGKFSADENIFRVMPLYGGPPTERTVNLMTPQGRNALNDAYDVVANAGLSDYLRFPVGVQNARNDLTSAMFTPNETLIAKLQNIYGGTGQFNQQLSNQLQNQGYRGILYNPQRWNEYEMLMLDPKYALPLDYRNMGDYVPSRYSQIYRKNEYDLPMGFTPKATEGINNIKDIMASNHSRLGDIYKERSWWDRLTPEVKEILLQDNPSAEEIIAKLQMVQ